MTEGSDEGNSLVRVRAQVMMRDDSTGGWVPMGGGGLSNVSVRKRILQADPEEKIKPEYLICGKRLSDQHVVLSCTIKKDFQYNKVMPTFHHWRTGDHKFGLTFQTAADARRFDKGVRSAVDDILDDNGDDDVFMAVNLPIERDGSRSSSGSVTTCSSGSRHTPTTTPLPLSPNTSPASTISNPPNTSNTPITSHQYLHRINYLSRHHKQQIPPDPSQDKIQVVGGEPPYSSYVQFAKNNPIPASNEYSYPMVESTNKSHGERRDSIASLKKQHQQQQLELVGGTPAQQMAPMLLHGKKGRKRGGPNRNNKKLIKVRCQHCQDVFVEDFNSRGSCEYAPDCVKSAIDKLTCISCAQCMLYHCMSDAEGGFPHHPCECGGPGAPPGGGTDESCGRRWVGLTLLSLLVPCLWCYLPLRACHKCAVFCGLCGGKHEAS